MNTDVELYAILSKNLSETNLRTFVTRLYILPKDQ